MNMIEASFNVLGLERNKIESDTFTPSLSQVLKPLGGFEGLFNEDLRSEAETAALKKISEELRELFKPLNIRCVFFNGIEKFDVDNSTFSTVDRSNPADTLIMHQELEEQASAEGKKLCCITRLTKPRKKALVLGTSFIATPELKFDIETYCSLSGVRSVTDNETWQSPRRKTGIAKSRRNSRKGGKK